MPAAFELSKQEILNRCFSTTGNSIGMSGARDAGYGAELSEQEIWNRAFDDGNSAVERIQMHS